MTGVPRKKGHLDIGRHRRKAMWRQGEDGMSAHTSIPDFQPPGVWDISVCGLSRPAWDICYSSLSWLIPYFPALSSSLDFYGSWFLFISLDIPVHFSLTLYFCLSVSFPVSPLPQSVTSSLFLPYPPSLFLGWNRTTHVECLEQQLSYRNYSKQANCSVLFPSLFVS